MPYFLYQIWIDKFNIRCLFLRRRYFTHKWQSLRLPWNILWKNLVIHWWCHNRQYIFLIDQAILCCNKIRHQDKIRNNCLSLWEITMQYFRINEHSLTFWQGKLFVANSKINCSSLYIYKLKLCMPMPLYTMEIK